MMKSLQPIRRRELALAVVGLILFLPIGLFAMVAEGQAIRERANGNTQGGERASARGRRLFWIAIAVGMVIGALMWAALEGVRSLGSQECHGWSCGGTSGSHP